MTPALIFGHLFSTLWWLIPVALVIGFFKTPFFKGMAGEALVSALARLLLDAKVYRAIHNVTLPTDNGTTQIDHIFVSRYGVFVVETKNYKGWIFGSEDQASWTQKLHRKTFKFQNPLRQNYKHLKTLESALDLPPEALHSVIAFVGECQFKTPMPANVCKGIAYIWYIKSKSEVILSDDEVERVFATIQSGRLTPSLATSREHVRNLQQAHSTARRCPRCGSSMVERTAKSGPRAGSKFWGCSTYPACRAVQQIS
jgi:predicted RNA-binding Zn-ribbon protein involved in translation (DUF1610 family)